MNDPNVVALGGGHGLANSLRALSQVTAALTAVVGVADDGGSSGRLRSEFGVLPPGDLRMAIAALCPDRSGAPGWAPVIQHRFPGDGELAGHSLGNLLITALWQQSADPVAGLKEVTDLLGARGAVLPGSTMPIDICARVTDPDAGSIEVRGQGRIAQVRSPVERVWLEPVDPPACAEALTAIANADAIVLGPGSWYTSVLPHLLIPEQREALTNASGRRILIMNVQPARDFETRGLALDEHIRIIGRYAPDLRIDTVIADPDHVADASALQRAAADRGAEVLFADVESKRPGIHDVGALAAALRTALQGS